MHNEFIGIEINVDLLDSKPKVLKLEHRQIFQNLYKKTIHPHSQMLVQNQQSPHIL